MLLTERLVVSELEKLFPDIRFNHKHSGHYVEMIKLCVLNKLKEKMKGASPDEIVSLMEEFTFKTERREKSLNSIRKIDDCLIEEIKEILLNCFNPNFISLKKDKKLSVEKQCLLFKFLLIQKDRRNFEILTYEEMNKYLEHSSNRNLKDIKEIRDLLRNKHQITETREHLFNHLLKQDVICNETSISEEKYLDVNKVMFGGYVNGMSDVLINLDYEIKITETHTEFLTKENVKGYILNVKIDNRELLRKQQVYKNKKARFERYKELFLSFDITK